MRMGHFGRIHRRSWPPGSRIPARRSFPSWSSCRYECLRMQRVHHELVSSRVQLACMSSSFLRGLVGDRSPLRPRHSGRELLQHRRCHEGCRSCVPGEQRQYDLYGEDYSEFPLLYGELAACKKWRFGMRRYLPLSQAQRPVYNNCGPWVTGNGIHRRRLAYRSNRSQISCVHFGSTL